MSNITIRKIKENSLVDTLTGEVLSITSETDVQSIVKSTTTEQFYFVYAQILSILYGKNLSYPTPRVFWWILEKFQGMTTDFSITKTLKEECVRKVGVCLRTVDSALKELSEESLLIKTGRATFMINPKFVWKGNIRDRQKYLSIEIVEDK